MLNKMTVPVFKLSLKMPNLASKSPWAHSSANMCLYV